MFWLKNCSNLIVRLFNCEKGEMVISNKVYVRRASAIPKENFSVAKSGRIDSVKHVADCQVARVDKIQLHVASESSKERKVHSKNKISIKKKIKKVISKKNRDKLAENMAKRFPKEKTVANARMTWEDWCKLHNAVGQFDQTMLWMQAQSESCSIMTEESEVEWLKSWSWAESSTESK